MCWEDRGVGILRMTEFRCGVDWARSDSSEGRGLGKGTAGSFLLAHFPNLSVQSLTKTVLNEKGSRWCSSARTIVVWRTLEPIFCSDCTRRLTFPLLQSILLPFLFPPAVYLIVDRIFTSFFPTFFLPSRRCSSRTPKRHPTPPLILPGNATSFGPLSA